MRISLTSRHSQTNVRQEHLAAQGSQIMRLFAPISSASSLRDILQRRRAGDVISTEKQAQYPVSVRGKDPALKYANITKSVV